MSIKNILYTAVYSFKEIKNSKIFYSFLIFALILISASYFVSQTSFISEGRIMVDFSIFSITIFNVFIGIFIGSSIVYDDIEKKSIFLSITRPVKRTDYLSGRVLGLFISIVFSTVIMIIIFYFVTLLIHKYVDPVKGWGLLGLYMLPQPVILQAVFIIIESIFISIIAILFSLITSKALASILSILVFFIGNVSNRMNGLVRPVKEIIKGKMVEVHHAGPFLTGIVHFIYTVLPNFSIFNISSEAAYKIIIPGGTFIFVAIYGICYSLFLFIIASLIFRVKDIS